MLQRLPDSRFHCRWLSLGVPGIEHIPLRETYMVIYTDEYWHWANFSLSVWEHDRMEGTWRQVDRSPSVQFDTKKIKENGNGELYGLQALCGLERGEIHGDTCHRMLYDTFWQGIRRSQDLRDWLKHAAPVYHREVIALLEEQEKKDECPCSTT